MYKKPVRIYSLHHNFVVWEEEGGWGVWETGMLNVNTEKLPLYVKSPDRSFVVVLT